MKLSYNLPILVVVLLFPSTIAGQGLPQLSDLTKQTDSSTTAASKTTESNSAAKTDSTTTTDNGDSKTTSPSKVSITNTGDTTTSASQTVPKITGSSTDSPGGVPTDLPKLSGAYSYPPATVPPTANAPYMRVSSIPEGTVFIAVGAFLGFLALTVLAWRGLTAWSLHRSVKRAALQQQIADTKAQFPPLAPMYKYSDRDSTISLGPRGKKGRPLTAGHIAAASQSLFFSPTAGAAGAGSLSHTGNRGSNYLPAGYYAAGASVPGGGAGTTHIGTGSRETINLSNLRPQSQGYSQTRISPPDSPLVYPHRAGNLSTSTLDLNPSNGPRTTAQRAPSAYFDDLLDESSGAPRHSNEHF